MCFSKTKAVLLLGLVCSILEASGWEILVHLNETYQESPQCNTTERGFMVTGLEIAWNHTLEEGMQNLPEHFQLHKNSQTPDCNVTAIDSQDGDYDVYCPKKDLQHMKEVRGVGQGNGNGNGNENESGTGNGNRRLQTQECCICRQFNLPCADEDPCASAQSCSRRRMMRTPRQPNLQAPGWIRNYVLESTLTDTLVYVYTEMEIECLLPVENAIKIVIVAREAGS